MGPSRERGAGGREGKAGLQPGAGGGQGLAGKTLEPEEWGRGGGGSPGSS